MKKIFKVAFYLRSNYRNKEGKIPLMLRIYLNNERINIGAVGISIVPELWDNKKLRLKGRTAEILQINQQLEQVQSTLQLIFHRQQYDPDISLDRIKSEYLGKKEEFGKISSLFGKVKGRKGTNRYYSKLCDVSQIRGYKKVIYGISCLQI